MKQSRRKTNEDRMTEMIIDLIETYVHSEDCLRDIVDACKKRRDEEEEEENFA